MAVSPAAVPSWLCDEDSNDREHEDHDDDDSRTLYRADRRLRRVADAIATVHPPLTLTYVSLPLIIYDRYNNNH